MSQVSRAQRAAAVLHMRDDRLCEIALIKSARAFLGGFLPLP